MKKYLVSEATPSSFASNLMGYEARQVFVGNKNFPVLGKFKTAKEAHSFLSSLQIVGSVFNRRSWRVSAP
jgi:hypothetical protein